MNFTENAYDLELRILLKMCTTIGLKHQVTNNQ